LLTGALAAAPALAGPNQGITQRTGPGSAERIKQETVVVTGIDRSARTVTLQNADGEKKTVNVPPDVKAYDTLTVGARIDISYQESIAVSLMPTGSKPSMSERVVDGKAEGAVAGGAKEMQISAGSSPSTPPRTRSPSRARRARSNDRRRSAAAKKPPASRPARPCS
jgi:hypothetical protein